MNLFNDIMAQGGTKALHRRQFEETKKLVNRWDKTGLLEGLGDGYDKHGMAIMLDNQARQLIDEVSKTGGPSAEEWSGVALPLVRRIFGEIASKDFVSIQPMNLPSGLVFFIDFKYGSNQPGFTTADGPTHQENTIYGVTSAEGEPTGGLYGAGRFGYSINDNSVSITPFAVNDSTWEDVNFNESLKAGVTAKTIRKVTFNLENLESDYNGVKAFTVENADGVTTMNNFYPAYTKPIDETGAFSKTKVTFFMTATDEYADPIDTDSTLVIKYHKQPVDYNRGDFESVGDPSWADGTTSPEKYSPTTVGANALDIPEIDVALRSEPIVAKTRKLKAVWTPEFAQDLNAYHSIDAEAELTAILSEYISMEIDLEILEMLLTNAVTSDVWSAKIGNVYLGSDTFGTQDAEEGRTLSYTQPEWFKTLGTKIQKVSNLIHQKTMRGGANFIVLSPKVATVLESIPGFQVATDGNQMSFAMGVQKVGSFNNRYTVYKNPYMLEDTVLMGYRGTAFLETGAVYAPYIPLVMTPIIYDPTNLSPRKGVMTRYAKKMVRKEFYASLKISDLQYI